MDGWMDGELSFLPFIRIPISQIPCPVCSRHVEFHCHCCCGFHFISLSWEVRNQIVTIKVSGLQYQVLALDWNSSDNFLVLGSIGEKNQLFVWAVTGVAWQTSPYQKHLLIFICPTGELQQLSTGSDVFPSQCKDPSQLLVYFTFSEKRLLIHWAVC